MSMEYTTAYGQLMDDLLKGQEFAARLQKLLRDSPEAGRIVDQILHTFSRVIHTIDAGAGEGSEAQSGVTCGGKRKAAAPAGGERSRASNRRRTLPSSGATKIVKNTEDGQAWRKYGQKEILNSKHPKSYFRCTHKYDQNCAAQRQVQRCDDDPDSFKVTYIGEHTCHDPHAVAAPPHHQTGAADGLHAGSHLICFAPSTTASVATNQTGLPMLKVEGGEQEEEEERSCLTPGSSAGHSTAPAAAGSEPEQGDVTSALNFGDDGADLRVFFDDYMCGLDDIFGSAR